ncbi:IS3-like element ISPssp1 family transposase [Psychrobacter sanguinis]|nr:IS3-like element ISPssp1 family transposase [Psychrobacter sanguinis]MCC3344232.1 IS3-like element ISPssp1 family transposase [Psychrobacter sanguinis]MCC3344569.1 IS3-like element ISPssp1 family transposase [Psychrobacter sanguinis]MCC3344603.1 IS3-like element ISPssp1 family transposase [Psychrobacter sanguinis]MCC3344606.1 IS3-like element ISPssp1 family transposase [Psychrobacter sanguinis]MCC3344618.1 IS3-like element ISPssp1 family transposase [Psychrobacter sanguinis]
MSKKRVGYSDTFKAEAIAKVKENNGNISQTAKELGIPMNTLANWHRKAERGVLAGTQNYNSELIAALDEIKDLKKQLRIAQEEREIPKKGNGVLCQESIAKYAFMQENRLKYCIQRMATVFEVSLSGYYDWLKRGMSKRKQHHNRCELLVKSAHMDTQQSYGHERLHQHLTSQGHDISLYMVRQIKQEHGIYCKRHKRSKVTTDSNHNKPVYPNLLEQQFDVAAPNIAWVSDITYIWTNEGWVYLAAFKDLYSKEIVGYALNKRMTADLVCEALNNAIKYKRPARGLIVHSDRGSQYCSHQYRQIIDKYGFAGSMSRKGNCYDNAPIESFWGQLKNELIYHKVYETRDEAIKDVVRYIEIFYNRQRIQKGLGFKSPTQVFQDFYRQAA